MKYMLLVYHDEDAYTDETRQACYIESTGLTKDLAAEGHFVDAAPLQSVTTATSVRVRRGDRQVTDGPFAETHEQLGGYYVVDAPDRETAIDIAARSRCPYRYD